MQRNIQILVLLVLCFSYQSRAEILVSEKKKNEHPKFKEFISIPMAGNCWAVTSDGNQADCVTDSGVIGWNNSDTKLHVYFKSVKTGNAHLALRIRVKSEPSTCLVKLGNEVNKIKILSSSYDTIYAGKFTIKNAGYQSLIISCNEGNAVNYPEISDLLIFENNKSEKPTYVKDDFYFGRRGPSVHLNYLMDQPQEKIEWFYNEIKVPEGNDIVGSFFMANGFSEGYFGIQVNSAYERRILFSVWSPHNTDKPDEIPDDERVILLKKGESVKAGSFGDEGSGGQSYRVFPWKAGTRYGFLIRGKPVSNNSTEYSAYFFAPESGQWELIACFKRPKTNTYLTHLHSFLENFLPEQGNITRMGIYSNQWVCDSKGKWTEINKVRFTADATARKGARSDYAGGISEKGFYLKNCGFFDKNTQINSVYKRALSGNLPIINFANLP